jgi:hypothetical protein
LQSCNVKTQICVTRPQCVNECKLTLESPYNMLLFLDLLLPIKRDNGG